MRQHCPAYPSSFSCGALVILRGHAGLFSGNIAPSQAAQAAFAVKGAVTGRMCGRRRAARNYRVGMSYLSR